MSPRSCDDTAEQFAERLSRRVDNLIRDKKRHHLFFALAVVLIVFLYLQLWFPDRGHHMVEVRNVRAQEAVAQIAQEIGGLYKIMTIDQPPTHQVIMNTALALIVLDEPSDGISVERVGHGPPMWKYPPANGMSFATVFGDPATNAAHAMQIFNQRGFADAEIAFVQPGGKLVVVVCPSAMVNSSLVFRKWGPLM